jgi:hypothetical protein
MAVRHQAKRRSVRTGLLSIKTDVAVESLLAGVWPLFLMTFHRDCEQRHAPVELHRITACPGLAEGHTHD